MITCLFTGSELDEKTLVEHTIPRSIGGRVRSKIVSSDSFNNLCSNRVDQVLQATYQPIYNHLGPLLSREHQPGSLDADAPDSVGRYKLRPGGILESTGWWPTSKDAKGRPISIEGDEKAVLREAKRRGVPEERYERVRLPKEPTKIQIPGMYCKEIELAVVKSGLLTFDHLLADSELRFTRNTSLDRARSLIRTAIMDGTPAKELHLRHVWGIDYALLPSLVEFREKHGKAVRTPFEHVLIASGNRAQGTVDLLWNVFSFEPHRFRLTWAWTGPDFTYLVVNGVLKGSPAPQDVTSISTPFRMGAQSTWRAQLSEDEFCKEAQEEFGEELADRRIEAYRRAVDLVERKADSYVVDAIVAETRFLVTQEAPEAIVLDGMVGRLESLFLDRNKIPEKRELFDAVVQKVRNEIPEEREADQIGDAEERRSHVDWDFWLAVHRDALDKLKPGLGLPGVQEKTEIEVEFNRI